MTAPVITVLITTHNYGQFIEQAIDSVLSQDFPLDQVEVLVVDDGSTDDTAERVKKYGSRIEYFVKPNGGQASALNFGFARARGEIVALLDADDLFAPSKLAHVAQAFQEHPGVGMVYHQLQEWHMNTDERRSWEFVEVSGDVHKEPEKFMLFVPQPTSAISFRRTSVSKLLPVPEEIRMLADCYLVALIPFLAPVLAIPKFLTVYRIHGKNSYSSEKSQVPIETSKYRLQMWQIVISVMRKWLADHGYTRKQLPVRSLLDRWTILLEREEFAVTPPGRTRFFLHLLRSHRYQLPLMSWRLVLINYSNALGSLVVGYETFHVLDESREHLTRWVRGQWRKTRRAPRLPEA
jgi:glycosyltransferase involved in cell wall biosynthesis